MGQLNPWTTLRYPDSFSFGSAATRLRGVQRRIGQFAVGAAISGGPRWGGERGHRPLQMAASPPKFSRPPIVATPPKVRRTLDTLRSIDSRKN